MKFFRRMFAGCSLAVGLVLGLHAGETSAAPLGRDRTVLKHRPAASASKSTASRAPATREPEKKTDEPSKRNALPPAASDSTSSTEELFKDLSAQIQAMRELVEKQQQQIQALRSQLEAVESREAATHEKAETAAQTASVAAETSSAAMKKVSEAAASPKPQQTNSNALLAGWDGNSFALRDASGNFRMRFEGFGQLDYNGYQAGSHPPNTFLFRRAELGIRGTVARYFDFRFQTDLTDRNSTLLRDAWVNIHRWEGLQFKVGQFREPFSQEEYRGSENQDFVERSAMNAMAPGRTPGAMIHGNILKGAVYYAAGAFNGKGIERTNTTNTPEAIVNLRLTPLKNSSVAALRGLTLGGAYAQGRDRNGSSFAGRSSSRSFVFFASEPVNGKITRANAEMQYLYGPFALRSEYDQVTQYRENLGPGGSNLTGVTGKGFMTQTTYLLTGETKTDSGAIAPRRPVFGGEGQRAGLGAWEVKFRFDTFQMTDGTAKGNRLATYTTGVTWHLNNLVRYNLDFGFERFRDPVRSPNPADRTFFVVLSRLQFMIN